MDILPPFYKLKLETAGSFAILIYGYQGTITQNTEIILAGEGIFQYAGLIWRKAVCILF
jgi:hypothetical protein